MEDVFIFFPQMTQLSIFMGGTATTLIILTLEAGPGEGALENSNHSVLRSLFHPDVRLHTTKRQ